MEQNEMIYCTCGCGKQIPKYSARGRENKFAPYHRTITAAVSNAARENQLKAAAKRRNPILTKEFLTLKYIHEGLSVERIAQEVGCAKCTVYRALKRNGIKTNLERGITPVYRNGIINDSNGYKRIRIPGHPKSNQAGYVSEHVLVVEQKYKRLPRRNEHIHHIDGDKQNNLPDNLLLCTRKEHGNIHASYEALLTELMKRGVIGFDGNKYMLL
jgi:flagellar basal body rod protein FlgC